MFSYSIQVYCVSMVYSDDSATEGHVKILYQESFVYIFRYLWHKQHHKNDTYVKIRNPCCNFPM